MSLIALFSERVLGAPVELDPRWAAGLVPPHVRIRANRWVPVIGGIFAGMRGPAAAVTFGRTILVHPRIQLSRQLLVHELVHVRQWEAERLFPLRYALEWVRRGYWNNRYEQEARAAEFDSDFISLDQ